MSLSIQTNVAIPQKNNMAFKGMPVESCYKVGAKEFKANLIDNAKYPYLAKLLIKFVNKVENFSKYMQKKLGPQKSAVELEFDDLMNKHGSFFDRIHHI